MSGHPLDNENLHGWYTGDGMTCLFNSDLAQNHDNFWPTVNPYRLRGTTVDTQTRANGSGSRYRSDSTWTGGAALERYGAAGMDLDAWNSTLVARRSWFMFDHEVVCLGAGITSSDGRTIETIVENRKLNRAGNNALTANGAAQSTALDWSATLPKVSWMHLVGNVAGADIGYYFPQAMSLRGMREARTGSWCDIDHIESATPFTRSYLTLWLDHGAKPVNATHAYVLLPGKSASDAANYAADADTVILQNTGEAQAVREFRLGVTAANFWNDGAQGVGSITVDRRASILLQVTDTNLAVAVADPTQTNATGISVTIARPVARILPLNPGVDMANANGIPHGFDT